MSKFTCHYNANPHQKLFHNDLTSKFLHLSGGYGSGKTHSLCMKAIQLSYLNKGIPGGLVAPDFADFEKDVLPTMEDILNKHRIKFDYRAGRYFQFPWTTAKLYLASAKKRIRGPNWGYALINELTLMPYVRYREVIARVRIKRSRYPQIASSGTPEGFGTDYHEHLIEKPFSDGVRVIYGSTLDNVHNLNADYIPSLTQSFDKVMLDAYLKGLFVNMIGNRFYYAYDTKNEDITIPEFDGDEQVYVAMDFNVEHMTSTVWRYDGRCLRGIDEIVILNNASTEIMCDEMKRRGYFPDNTIIFPDTAGKSRRTSGKSDVEIIKQAGYRDVRYRQAAPQFRGRQLNGNNLLQKGLVKIHPERMPAMKRDFLAVIQDPTTTAKVKDNPKLTHASDGFDYMVDLLFPFSGKRSGVTVHKYR
jgi:hypothetical protein